VHLVRLRLPQRKKIKKKEIERKKNKLAENQHAMESSASGGGTTTASSPFPASMTASMRGSSGSSRPPVADSPSVRDGVPPQLEIRHRRETCDFLQQAGIKLKLYTLAIHQFT
jgi:hypothetical protein